MSKAPGKSHRKGNSIMELMRMFPDDKKAEEWFAECRWNGEPHCPRCGSLKVQTGANHPTMPYRCRENGCRKHFSVKIGTVMEGSNLGYRVWAIAIFMMTTSLKGVSSMKLHRDLAITQKAAWHLAHRIRQAWGSNELTRFSGPVEAGETYVDGKEKNKQASKKLCAGRGPVGKAAIAGVKDRETNQVSAKVVEWTDAKTPQSFVEVRTASDAQVYTDEAAAYRGIDRAHETVSHSVGEYVRDMAHTNGMESFWAGIKRGYHGVYHKMSPKHLNRYVGKFAGRHNDRPEDTRGQMSNMAVGMVGKRLKYADLIADNSLSSGAQS